MKPNSNRVFDIIKGLRHIGFISSFLRFRNAFHLCGMANVKKLVAFTLAETLIVMGIIGIVSALTIPNLNSSTGEKEKIVKVKKLYQNMTDALGRAQAVYGPVDEWKQLDSTQTAQTTRFGDRLSEFMKVSKNCGVDTNKGCFPTSSGAVLQDSNNTVYKMVLADGSLVGIDLNYSASIAGIFIDIEKAGKGTHYATESVFFFSIKNNELVFEAEPSDLKYCATSRGDSANSGFYRGSPITAARFCAGWVMLYDNMDYLKTGSGGKCKNSSITLDPTANPPVTSCK